jgi:flagellar basal body-associated protein FliL
MKELRPIEESWNKKKVFLGLVFLVILIAGLVTFKTLVLDKNQNSPTTSQGDVKGASTDANSPEQNNAAADLKTNIQDQLNTIQQEASNINITDIATSSPQVQKVIDDIKSIQNLPKEQAKSFCEQVCSGL